MEIETNIVNPIAHMEKIFEEVRTTTAEELAKKAEGKTSEERASIEEALMSKNLKAALRNLAYPAVGGFQPTQKSYWADKFVGAAINATVLVGAAAVGAYVLRRSTTNVETTEEGKQQGEHANPFHASDVNASERPSRNRVASV